MLSLIVAVLYFGCAYGALLVRTMEGAVPRDNFTYFTVNYGGNIMLELNTKEGDADLYVAEGLLTPHYEPDRYDLHSATCGADIIYVPKSFVRPLGVGVYGHSAHEFSYYTLGVFVATLQDDLAAHFEDVERRHESSRRPVVVVEDTAPATTPEKKQNQKLKKVLTKSGLWALLEMFEMIFL